MNNSCVSIVQNMEKKTIISIIFHFLLFFLAAYYVGKQFSQFLENKDSSTLTLTKFNTNEKDKYPTFYICLTVEKSEEGWRNPGIIRNFYHTDLINEKLDMDMKSFVTTKNMVAKTWLSCFMLPAGVSSVEIWLPNTSTSC